MLHSHDEIPIDGELGDPLGFTSIHTSDEPAERTLQLRADLATGPFEFAVRERVARLSAFRHSAFVTIHRVERMRHPSRLFVVGDVPAGSRLRDVLGRSTSAPPMSWSIEIVKGLLEGVAKLHDVGPDVAHGLITPERIFVDEAGRVALTDYVFALAIQQLRYSTERYGTELHLPLPANSVLFDQRLDLFQIGTVAKRLWFGEHSLPEPVTTDGLHAWVSQLTESRAPWRTAREALEALLPLARTGEGTPAPVWRFEPGANDAASRVSISTSDDVDADDLEEAGDFAADSAAMAEPSGTLHLSQSLAGVDSATWIETALQWPERRETERLAPEMKVPDADTVEPAVPGRWNGIPPAAMIADLPSPSRRLPTTLAVFAVLIVLALVGRARSGPSTVGRLLPTAAAAPGTVRDIDLSKAQGSQRVATDGEPGERAPVGTLNIRTEPAGIPVSVDGRAVGRAPVTVELAPGKHRVILPGADVEQTVAVEAETTTLLVIPLASKTQPPTRAGWMEVRGPIDAQVLENGQVIATTDSPRVMLPAGLHHVEVVNAAAGFREAHTVEVKPAAVSTWSFQVPDGAMAVNAVPWADVSLDGQPLGATPLGNIRASVGRHEVVFRHPAYGEQRRTVIVPVQGIARLSIDFTKGAP
jgi:hypothetical protein